MQRLIMVGMNHATAPLAIREKFAFSAEQRQLALTAFADAYPTAEAVLVSTCNRVELYACRPIHGHPRIEDLVSFLADFHGICVTELRPHIYERANRAVVEHLFTVASSLDSLVVGETQILGQIREAYELSKKSEANSLLHPLFQRAVAAAREVMAKTGLTDGKRSVASIAVEYARQIFETFDDKTVLSIGAGKMSTLALQHFSELQVKRLMVCNRDMAKAESLAERFGGEAVPLETLADHLVEADIVISSTGSPVPIIKTAMFQQVLKRRRWRPVFLVDIALPRDVEEGVGALENVYLYNIDDLQQVAAATDSNRKVCVEMARTMVLKQVDDFVSWHTAREVGPLIEELFAKSHGIAKDEVLRTLNKLPDLSVEQRQHVEDMARRIVNKLLNDPVRAVRESGTGSSPFVRAVAKLFKLSD